MHRLARVGLAEQTGCSPERVDELAELGIVTPQADDSFRPAGLQRVKLIDAPERSGNRLQDLGRAVRSDDLSFAFLDLLFTQPKGYSTKTYKDACAEYGCTMEFVEWVHEALGLPVPSAEDRVREDDKLMFSIGQFALATGIPEAGAIRSLRVYVENLGRITQAESSSSTPTSKSRCFRPHEPSADPGVGCDIGRPAEERRWLVGLATVAARLGALHDSAKWPCGPGTFGPFLAGWECCSGC